MKLSQRRIELLENELRSGGNNGLLERDEYRVLGTRGDINMLDNAENTNASEIPIEPTDAPNTNDEVTSTLHRLANNEAVDERLGVPPAEMARMVDANARFRASMGPLSVGEMLSLRDEFQSAFDSIGGGAASSTSALVEQVRAAMPPSAQVYAFSDATYVVEPSTNTGIAVRSGSSGVSFSLHLDGAIHDALALAKECIESAKTAEKERDTAVRRHKKLKDAFNAKVAEKAGYYKQYAKLVREF